MNNLKQINVGELIKLKQNVMCYEWLFFDLDNTLLDFDRSSKYAFEKAFNDFKIPFDTSYYGIYNQINKQHWLAFEQGTITQATLRTKRFEVFLEAIRKDCDAADFSACYLSNLANVRLLLDGAIPLLDKLKGQFQLLVITNGLKEVQRPRIKVCDLEQYFDGIVVSDEIGVAKPHKGFFDYAFNEIGNPSKEKVLVIGDSLSSDIAGGNQYGIDTCWYNPKKNKNKTEHKPTFEIANLAALEAIVFGK